jgi:hypothetical protein
MHWTVLCVLLAAGALTKESKPIEKPACSAAIHGRFWPAAANTDYEAARKLAQCGALDICTNTGRRYKWRPVTVNVRQLGTTPQEPTAACVAVMAEFGGSSAKEAPLPGGRGSASVRE